MNSDPSTTRPPADTTDRLPEQFARTFLETRGAVVERKQAGWDALLPRKLGAELGIPDLISIRREGGEGAAALHHDGQPEAESLGYGSPLIERMIAAATHRMPRIQCRVHFDYLKQEGFTRLVSDTFTFHGAIGKAQNRAQIQTAYLLIDLWYQAQSDEQQEGLLSLTFHGETGVCVPWADAGMTGIQREYLLPGKPGATPRDLSHLADSIRREVERQTTRTIQPFQQNMNRRFQRDVRHLTEYYDNLREEMEKSLSHPGLTEQTIQERREKIALLPSELQHKSDDLFKKYSIRIAVRPCAAQWIQTPAMKVHYRLTIGKTVKTLPLVYNPLTRTMDPCPCAGCGSGTYVIRFDDRFQPLCNRCAGG